MYSGHLGIGCERLGSVVDRIGSSSEHVGSVLEAYRLGLSRVRKGGRGGHVQLSLCRRRSCSTKLVISGEGWRVNRVELITSKERFVNSWLEPIWFALVPAGLR